VTDGSGTRFGRRELLSGAAAAALGALAGCVTQFVDESPPTIDGSDLRAATRGDPPAVPDILPVDIEASFVETLRADARSKLDGTPAPFDEAEIPNGVIRGRLNDAYDDALRSIRDASGAPTSYERLAHAARSRTSAHEVEAAWDGISDELTAADLRASIPDVNRAVDGLASTHAYVGDGPVRAAVVHANLERRIGGARRWLSVSDREFAAATNALYLAEIAADIERARVDVAVASYLFDRFRGSLDAATDHHDRLTDARAALETRIHDRADPVPEERVDDATSLVDRDVGTTAGVRALEELAWEARSRIEQVRRAEDAADPASDVVGAASVLTHLGAFGRLRNRIEGGDDVAVDTAADVGELRSAAITAVEAAGSVERGQVLADAIRPRFAREVERVDGRLDDGRSEVRVASAARDAAGYVRIAALCLSLPEAVGTTATTLLEST